MIRLLLIVGALLWATDALAADAVLPSNVQASALAATSCGDGVNTGSDGTAACLAPEGPVEFPGSTFTAGGSIAANAVVMLSAAGTVVEATTTAVSVVGCGVNTSTVTSSNPVAVAFSGRVVCKAGTVTAGRRVGVGSTGQLENATAGMFTVGLAITSASSGTAEILFDAWASNSRKLIWAVNKTSSLEAFSAVRWDGTDANEVVVADARTDDRGIAGIAQNAVTAAVDDVIPVLISGAGMARSAGILIANQEFTLSPSTGGEIEACCPSTSGRALGRAMGTVFSSSTLPVLVYDGAPPRRPAVLADVPAAGCNAGTGVPVLEIGSSSAPAVSCLSGATNFPRGVLGFDDSSAEYAYFALRLPNPFYSPASLWGGLTLYWYAAATTGSVKWNADAVCVGSSDPEDPSYSNTTTTATTAADTGHTLDLNVTTLAWNNPAMLTGCEGGDLMHIRVWRDGANGADTMTGDALLGRLVVRDNY